MKCETEFQDINYNTEIFCKECGMDIGLDPIKKRIKGKTMVYCCEDCSTS